MKQTTKKRAVVYTMAAVIIILAGIVLWQSVEINQALNVGADKVISGKTADRKQITFSGQGTLNGQIEQGKTATVRAVGYGTEKITVTNSSQTDNDGQGITAPYLPVSYITEDKLSTTQEAVLKPGESLGNLIQAQISTEGITINQVPLVFTVSGRGNFIAAGTGQITISQGSSGYYATTARSYTLATKLNLASYKLTSGSGTELIASNRILVGAGGNGYLSLTNFIGQAQFLSAYRGTVLLTYRVGREPNITTAGNGIIEQDERELPQKDGSGTYKVVDKYYTNFLQIVIDSTETKAIESIIAYPNFNFSITGTRGSLLLSGNGSYAILNPTKD